MTEAPNMMKIMLIFYGLLVMIMFFVDGLNVINVQIFTLPTINFNSNILDLFGILSFIWQFLVLIWQIIGFSVGNFYVDTFLWIFRVIMIAEVVLWVKRIAHPTLA
jgi:hypothetical protein